MKAAPTAETAAEPVAAPGAVLITGGGGGIGAATARRLAAAGTRVVIVDRRVEAAEAVLGGLPGEGHLAFGIDVADAAQVIATVAEALDALG